MIIEAKIVQRCESTDCAVLFEGGRGLFSIERNCSQAVGCTDDSEIHIVTRRASCGFRAGGQVNTEGQNLQPHSAQSEQGNGSLAVQASKQGGVLVHRSSFDFV
ncbi:hypothetical protein SAMN04488056_102142 [Cohaesibacter marisflavi]|uniref:Uncharacterized protein n=1 Tax=Cohaesibacter marisflavi TaxID=655353 RepID=A0A1I5C8I6_9HYPH|nr:hypothetical protein SAMN04488056_102142 [Cohaesibacter marisflavi]